MFNYPYGDSQQINLNWIISEIIALHQQLDPNYTAPTFTQIYPFSTTQQLNLDWILTELKALKELAPAPTPVPTDAIDEVGQALIAGAYDANTQYQKNDYIVKDEKLYRANAATTGAFDPTKWREVLLGDDLAIITRWADATNAYLNVLAASNVANDSDVTGATVKDALNKLKDDISAGGTPNAVTNVRYSNHYLQQEKNGSYTNVLQLEDNPTNNSGRVPSSKAFYNLRKETEETLPILETKNYLGLTMDSEIAAGLSYADAFGLYNELSVLYLDAWTYAPMYLVAGTPTIEEHVNPISQGHNVLKCFGSSSQQISNPTNFQWFNLVNGHYYYIAFCINVTRYVSGWCGISFTQSDALPNLYVEEITDGWTIKDEIAQYNGTTGFRRLYMGTGNSANADCYISVPVVIDLTAAGIQNLTLAELRDIYKQYITMTDAIEFRLRKLNEKKPMLAATVLDADSASDRFLAAKQLFDLARKILINPYYSMKPAEFAVASKGSVCKLREYNGAMFEKYPFNFLYTQNGAVAANPASTTKVMNAITALRYVTDLNAEYTIESGDIVGGSGSIYEAGDILTIRDILHAMFLESSNTCANALGTYAGRLILGNPSASNTAARNAFVNRMRSLSPEIGCLNSFWKNASGYNQTDSYTTTEDLMQILYDACSFPDILRIWNKTTYDINVKGTNPRTITITTTVANENLETYYYIFGGKTGQSANAQALVIICEPK